MFRFRGFALAVLAAVAALAAAPVATAAQPVFSGRATVVSGTVLGQPITLVDTGPVAAEGGELEANLLCYPNGTNCVVTSPIGDPTDGAVQAQVLHAAVVAHGNKSQAEASVAEFSLAAAGHTIGAEFLQAEAEATCADGKAFVRGDVDLAELVIDGQRLAVDPTQVNQRIDLDPLLGSHVIVNEQIATAEGNRGDITVRALHIVIPGVADVVVAEAHADIVCGVVAGGCRGSRVTGGGWYDWPAAPNRVHFALAARDGLSSWGHLNYMDKAMGLKVKGTPQAAVITPATGTKNDGAGVVEGTASANRQVNGQSVGYFIAEFVDAGEPGRSDKFAITLLTQRDGEVLFEVDLSAAPTLAGGNLQVHACK